MSMDVAEDSAAPLAPASAPATTSSGAPPLPVPPTAGSKVGGAVPVDDIFSASPVAVVAGGGKRATAAQLAMDDLHALGDDR
jgi:hypothetical protein